MTNTVNVVFGLAKIRTYPIRRYNHRHDGGMFDALLKRAAGPS